MKLNKKVGRIIPLICCLFWVSIAFGQKTSLSLEEAYTLLENNYPALQRDVILNQIHEKELEQLDKMKLPSLYLKGDGRFQSQSTQLDKPEGSTIPFEINQPLISIKAYAEANYMILDGGLDKAQRKIKAANLKVEQQNIAVDRFALRERINQLFLGIVLLREQSKLFDLTKADIRARTEQVAAGVENGILLESELTKLEVKSLELEAQQSNVQQQLKGLVNTLSDLTGTELENEVDLTFPDMPSVKEIPELNRPEQQLFQIQKEAILARTDLIEADRKVKLTTYAQAGIGYPNPLNILDNNLAPYGILGAQASWKITDWKKGAIDKELLTLQTMQLEKAKETFDFNVNSREAAYLAEVDRLQEQIASDKKIAGLQTKILEQLAVQLEEGIITSTDYITQLNAELLSRQSIVIHETEIVKAQLNFLNERGALK